MTAALDYLVLPSRPRLVMGAHTLDQLGTCARELGARRALIVTDRGIVAAGHAERAAASLAEADVAAFVFDRVIENPNTDTVEQCRDVARQHDIDLFIGLGGGSSMDAAKGANFLLTGGGQMRDYHGIDKATQPMLPLIAVPTTAGTGSETQSFALISDAATHEKMACGDPKAMAATVILDPVLTLTQPSHVAANSGIDALAHAIETAVTTKRTAESWPFSERAFAMLTAALPRVFADGDDVAARADMQLGAALAGMAIERSMLGAAHAMANPLTATFGITHGTAVGVVLPTVVRFNAELDTARSAYAALVGNDDEPGEAVASMLSDMLQLVGLPVRLRALGVDESDIASLAEHAATQWTGTFNPRPVEAPTFAQLYRRALGEP